MVMDRVGQLSWARQAVAAHSVITPAIILKVDCICLLLLFSWTPVPAFGTPGWRPGVQVLEIAPR
jgi:hypothetical protein